jgi:aspartyl-tRNA(Asn)/glutamyl-tRNA(Gln) amidotransferase subunit A
MKQLAFASIKTLRKKLSSKEISAQELLHFTLERFKKHDEAIGSSLEIFDKAGLEVQAKTLAESGGPLAGIPGLIKDNICQKGHITSCASKMLEHFVAPYDATVAVRLKTAGAYSVGRANCDEFAMGSSTETSAFKKTKNPWDLSCVPGGSSGGSAAAVAAGLVPWALGSETGGSVRQPAALCGIVGLKPTYGLLSRFGLVAYASSLDAIGIFTRTVYDNALVLSQVTGSDNQDSTALQNIKKIDYTASLSGSINPGTKIGVIDNMMDAEGIDPEVRARLDDAVQALKKLGAEIVHISLPIVDHSAAVYFMISRAEAASNLARFDGVRYGFRAPGADSLTDMYEETRLEGFGPEVRRRILIGNYVLSAGHADQYYKSAKTVQAMMRQDFLDTFKNVDLLFAPVTPTTAFKFDAFADNKLQMDLQDYFTAFANLAGLPALAVPCGFVQNMPVGFQLVGAHLSEELILQTAHAYEHAHDWVNMHPENFQ